MNPTNKPKTPVLVQGRKQPIAPPVYRPQPLPRVLQTRQIQPGIQKKEAVQPRKPSLAANLKPNPLRQASNALAVQRTATKTIAPPKVILPPRPAPKIPT